MRCPFSAERWNEQQQHTADGKGKADPFRRCQAKINAPFGIIAESFCKKTNTRIADAIERNDIGFSGSFPEAKL